MVPLRIFVFDDESSIRRILERLLSREGYEVFSFSRPVLCDPCLCSEGEACADIIISDLRMPVVGGLEFIENQQARGCKAAQLAVASGRWSDADLDRARELGCRVFAKPFSGREIRAWVEQCAVDVGEDRVLAPWFQRLAEKKLPRESR